MTAVAFSIGAILVILVVKLEFQMVSLHHDAHDTGIHKHGKTAIAPDHLVEYILGCLHDIIAGSGDAIAKMSPSEFFGILRMAMTLKMIGFFARSVLGRRTDKEAET